MKSRILIIALTATLLSGCGFHLRNALNLPANLGPVRVLAADRYSPLSEMLADGLQRAGAQAAAVIELLHAVEGKADSVGLVPVRVVGMAAEAGRQALQPG